MKDSLVTPPVLLAEIQNKCQEMGFEMASDEKAGALLRTLVASKPAGRFLELGTGIGASLCWMRDGMSAQAELTSVDNDPLLTKIAHSFFGNDTRVELVCEDGEQWIKSYQGPSFDLIFADAWPGKYSCFKETIDLLSEGGFYVIDDMMPHSDWPVGHHEKASALLDHLSASHEQLVVTMMDWSTGLVVCTKK